MKSGAFAPSLKKQKNMIIRIDEAIARAKANGNRVYKREIAARIWPNSSPAAQQVNMTALCNGSTERVAPEWVRIICEMTGVSSDFLMGLSND